MLPNPSPIRVYTDTTVFGGIVDSEFAKTSQLFFQRVREGRLSLVLSDLVVQEIAAGPQSVRDLLDQHYRLAEVVDISMDAIKLQRAYIAAGFVRAKSHNDAIHVATATVHRCSLIVSWNFRDIVNFRKIPLYNEVNVSHGYGNLAIYSPLEVTKDDDENV